MIYATIVSAAIVTAPFLEGCVGFAIYKRRARVRIPSRSVSERHCCCAAAACSFTPHADPANSREVLRAAARLCACWHQPELSVVCSSAFVAPRVASSCSSSISSFLPGACDGELQWAVLARAGNEGVGVRRARRGESRLASATRGDARPSSPGSALGLSAGRHGGVQEGGGIKNLRSASAIGTHLPSRVPKDHESSRF